MRDRKYDETFDVSRIYLFMLALLYMNSVNFSSEFSEGAVYIHEDWEPHNTCRGPQNT